MDEIVGGVGETANPVDRLTPDDDTCRIHVLNDSTRTRFASGSVLQ